MLVGRLPVPHDVRLDVAPHEAEARLADTDDGEVSALRKGVDVVRMHREEFRDVARRQERRHDDAAFGWQRGDLARASARRSSTSTRRAGSCAMQNARSP